MPWAASTERATDQETQGRERSLIRYSLVKLFLQSGTYLEDKRISKSSWWEQILKSGKNWVINRKIDGGLRRGFPFGGGWNKERKLKLTDTDEMVYQVRVKRWTTKCLDPKKGHSNTLSLLSIEQQFTKTSLLSRPN